MPRASSDGGVNLTVSDLVEECLETALEHYEAGRLADALADWRTAFDLDPLDANVRYNMGLGLHDSGLPVEATHHWREAIRLSPDFFQPHYHLVCVLAKDDDMDVDRWREVGVLCGHTLSLDTASAQQEAYLRRLLALAQWSLGERRKAVITMKAALALEPDLWTYERLSRMQLRMGQWRASHQTFQAMTELPDYDFTWYEPCHRRLKAIGVVALVGSAVLAWRLTRRK